VRLTGIHARGFHGVLPEERRDGQVFVVDVDMSVDVAPAAASDDLAQTVDYSVVAAEVVDVVAGPACDLIETLAVRIAHRVLRHPLVDAVTVTVHKPMAPVGVPFDDVAVSVTRTRA
jgi:dihydroneopterin aldolase/2-amino-4-hydroxy-6-hydroxymethyldihydropteridine diphosphokinase